jgi:hypothetical protein
MPKLTKAEAELLELMRVDRPVLGQRQAEQVAVDLEAAGNTSPQSGSSACQGGARLLLEP